MLKRASTGALILVTGGSGFIGKPVVTHLLQAGFRVRILTRTVPKKPVQENTVEYALGDMRDSASLLAATQDVQGVVHLAALKIDEPESVDVNVHGAQRLVDAARKNNVAYVINISSSSTKIAKKGLYASTKDAADKIIEASGVPYTTLKPSIVYGDLKSGVFGSLARFAKLPITPVVGNGKCVFWPIHVEDLAEVIARTALQETMRGKTYDVGGPEGFSINELLKKISEDLWGKKHTILVHVPARLGLLLASILERITSHAPITRSNVLGSTQDVAWDIESVYRDTEFTPRVLDIGLAQIRTELRTEEARLVLRYISSRAPKKIEVSEALAERYCRAVRAHTITTPLPALIIGFPFLLGALDVVTKLFYPHYVLQTRLQIAGALVECDPESAVWLLPQRRSYGGLLLLFIKSGIAIAGKLLLGLLLLCIPGFVKKYAGSI